MYAPIILFVYNRPWHTQQTLEALSRCELAAQSTLYIFADGPKIGDTQEQLQKVQEVRKVIRKEQWCGEVNIVERDKNWGLAANIINGVSNIVNQHGRIIVLEDDIVTSVGFLKYMNDALDVYENEEKVMHVSAYMFPVKGYLPTTFFYKQASCWGWGTWKSSWKLLETNPKKLLYKLHELGTEAVAQADFDNTRQFLNQLEANAGGILETWAVKWQFTIFLQDGLCLHPHRSLVQNIGSDGTGIHCGSTNRFKVIPADYVLVKKVSVTDHQPVYKLLKRFYKGKSTIHKKGLREFVGNWLPPAIMKSIRLFGNKPEKTNNTYPSLRFVPAHIPFRGVGIKIVDIASFKFIEKEIFGQQIYKFHTNTPVPYIIDAGANIGLGIIYFKQLYPNSEIVAFEPDKIIFEVLDYNVHAFNFKNVELIPKAIWKNEGILPFISEGADAGRIAVKGENSNLIEVPSVRLRNYLNRKVDMLKIDIEGAETMVLEDCKDLLVNVERIFVEYHSLKNQPQSLHQLLQLLNIAGFRYNVQHIGVYSHHPFVKINDYMGMDLQLNIFAYRQ